MKKKLFALSITLFTLSASAQKAELKEASKLLNEQNYTEAQNELNKIETLFDSATEEQKAEFYFLTAQTALHFADSESDGKSITKAINAFRKVSEIEKEAKSNKFTAKSEPLKNELLSQIVNAAVNDNSTKRYKNASRKFDQAFQLNPKDTLYLFYAASTAINAEDYDFAENKYKELVNLKYDGATVYYTAIEKANGAVQSFGDDKKMRDLLVRQGSHVQPKTVTEPSKRPMILKNLALILINKENYSEAEGYILEAFKLNPNDDEVLMSLLNLYSETNRFDKFTDIANAALAKNPNNALLNYNLGIISSNEGKDEEAKNYFLKSIQIDPKLDNAYLGIANLILKQDADITNEMNNTGVSSAGQQKFKSLKQKKIGIYNDALSYLIKATEINKNNESINSLIEEIESYLNSEK